MNGKEVTVLYMPFWMVSVKFDNDAPVLRPCQNRYGDRSMVHFSQTRSVSNVHAMRKELGKLLALFYLWYTL
jgi:hypothetical protein